MSAKKHRKDGPHSAPPASPPLWVDTTIGLMAWLISGDGTRRLDVTRTDSGLRVLATEGGRSARLIFREPCHGLLARAAIRREIRAAPPHSVLVDLDESLLLIEGD